MTKDDKEDIKFKVVSNVRISKYEKFFEKASFPNQSEEVFVITKVKKLFREHILKKLLERFTKKNYKRQIEKSLDLKK